MQVDTLLELLGKDTLLEKLSLNFKDEKLPSFYLLVNKLKHLQELEIIFPEATQLIEFSDLLAFSLHCYKHQRMRKLKISSPRINTQVKHNEEVKFNEAKLLKGTYSNLNFYEHEYQVKIDVARFSTYVETYRITMINPPTHKVHVHGSELEMPKYEFTLQTDIANREYSI